MTILSVAIVAVALLVPGAAGEPRSVCGTTGIFTANSTYLANINLVAAYLPKNASASPNLFATAEDVGAIPAQVSALALCRGDSNATSCRSCLDQAFIDLVNSCAYIKDAAIYYDSCKLYYSNVHFPTAADSGMISLNLELMTGSGTVTSETDRFNHLVSELVNATADYAAYNTTRRYAAGEADFNLEFSKIYSMAQCTPDLTPARCRSCLAQTVAYANGLVLGNGLIGGRIDTVRCSFRYETSPFINGPVMVRLPGTPASSGAPAQEPLPTVKEMTRHKGVNAVYIAVPTVAAILAAIVACFCARRRLMKAAAKPVQSNPTNPDDDVRNIDFLLLDLQALHIATDGFAEHKRLGEGGFGIVYKGILPDGQQIAVKRLSQSSKQGIGELKTELLLIAKLNHKNLVKLVGVCLEKQEKILVYEYMANRSLDTILFDTEKNKQLDWGKRLKIINGIARGLQYLHEESQMKIIHRDLKASNVLLDSSYNPKISDFGLAKIFEGDQSQIITRRIAGTYGYMSPEYAMRGQYSIKSDVFSFGVLILEIVTGRRNCGSYNSEQGVHLHLIHDTWEHWTREKSIEMIDPSLINHCPIDQLLRCIHIGLFCVQERPADRPLMSAVSFMLSSELGEPEC